MNYLKPELLDALAAEYVLGTLTGAARIRFERLQAESLQVRQAVWRWEQDLTPMIDTTEIDTAAAIWQPRVWRAVESRVFSSIDATAHQSVVSRWTGWTGWAAALVLALTLGWQQWPAPSESQPLALIQEQASKPLWLVTTTDDGRQLKVSALNVSATAIDEKAYELWMLTQDGTPRSLGVMPVGYDSQHIPLSPQLLELLQQSNGLAVSIEPRGGSPTGSPTGPVVHKADIVHF